MTSRARRPYAHAATAAAMLLSAACSRSTPARPPPLASAHHAGATPEGWQGYATAELCLPRTVHPMIGDYRRALGFWLGDEGERLLAGIDVLGTATPNARPAPFVADALVRGVAPAVLDVEGHSPLAARLRSLPAVTGAQSARRAVAEINRGARELNLARGEGGREEGSPVLEEARSFTQAVASGVPDGHAMTNDPFCFELGEGGWAFPTLAADDAVDAGVPREVVARLLIAALRAMVAQARGD